MQMTPPFVTYFENPVGVDIELQLKLIFYTSFFLFLTFQATQESEEISNYYVKM